MELELLKRFELAEADTLDAKEFATLHNVILTNDGLISFTCWCGRKSYHEPKEVARYKVCKNCDRGFVVPSPPHPTFEDTEAIKKFIRTKAPVRTTRFPIIDQKQIERETVQLDEYPIPKNSDDTPTEKHLPLVPMVNSKELSLMVGRMIFACVFISLGSLMTFLYPTDLFMFMSGVVILTLSLTYLFTIGAINLNASVLFTCFLIGLASVHKLTTR